MSGIYRFEWRRDKGGYVIRLEGGHGDTLLGRFKYECVEGLGGPIDAYRPLEEYPALWRQFAHDCATRDGIIPFTNTFGTLSETLGGGQYETVARTIEMAELLAAIAEDLDKGDIDGAVAIFNAHARPHMTAKLVKGKKGYLELTPIPTSLESAMLLQAAEALSGNYQFRKCLNCPAWMRLGAGSHSTRRMFCCDRCRVAFNRKMKRGIAA